MNSTDLLNLLLPDLKINPYYQNPLSIMVRVLFLSMPFFIVPSVRKAVVGFSLRFGRPLLVALTIAAVLGYVVIFIWYGSVDEYFDHVEPAVASVSWLFADGKPVYQGLDEPMLYNLPYGPMLFIINGAILKLLGPSLEVSKVTAVFSFMSAMVFMFFAYRNVIGGRKALVFFGTSVLILHMYGYKGFWVRSDPVLLLCVSAGLWGVTSGRRLISASAVALALGVALGLKVHSAFYFFPVITVFLNRFGFRTSLIAVSAAVIVSALPFLIFENISLDNYLDSIQHMTAHNIVAGELPVMFSWAVFISLPMLLSLLYRRESMSVVMDNALFYGSLDASMFLVCIIGTIPGAGSHHLMPFIPLVGYGGILMLKENSVHVHEFSARAGVLPSYIVWLGASLVFTACVFIYSWTSITYLPLKRFSEKNNYAFELREIMHANQGYTIGMGYDGFYRATYYRPLLIFEGNPHILDTVTLMDMQLVTGEPSSKTLDLLSECKVDIWLVPRGGKPFSTVNRYYNFERLFPSGVTDLFMRYGRYKHIERTKYYDLWLCLN